MIDGDPQGYVSGFFNDGNFEDFTPRDAEAVRPSSVGELASPGERAREETSLAGGVSSLVW